LLCGLGRCCGLERALGTLGVYGVNVVRQFELREAQVLNAQVFVEFMGQASEAGELVIDVSTL